MRYDPGGSLLRVDPTKEVREHAEVADKRRDPMDGRQPNPADSGPIRTVRLVTTSASAVSQVGTPNHKQAQMTGNSTSTSQEPLGSAFLDEYCLVASDRVLQGGTEDAFPEDMLELFNLLEALCLKTRLLVPGLGRDHSLPDSQLVDNLSDCEGLLMPFDVSGPLRADDVLRAIQRHRLLSEVKKLLEDMRGGTGYPTFVDSATGELLSPEQAVGKRVSFSEEYLARTRPMASVNIGLQAEECFDMPLVPSIRDTSRYVESLGLDVTCSMFTQWERVYYRMAERLRTARQARRGLVRILHIPPIAWFVLNFSDDLADIIPTALRLRDSLESFRSQYLELQIAEADPQVSDQEFYQRVQQLRRISSKLLADTGGPGPHPQDSQVGTCAADVLDLVDATMEDALDGVQLEDVSLKGILNLVTKYPLRLGWDAFTTRKFRTLFHIGKRFRESRYYHTVVPRLWGRSLSEQEIIRVEDYAKAAQELLELQLSPKRRTSVW